MRTTSDGCSVGQRRQEGLTQGRSRERGVHGVLDHTAAPLPFPDE